MSWLAEAKITTAEDKQKIEEKDIFEKEIAIKDPKKDIALGDSKSNYDLNSDTINLFKDIIEAANSIGLKKDSKFKFNIGAELIVLTLWDIEAAILSYNQKLISAFEVV